MKTGAILSFFFSFACAQLPLGNCSQDACVSQVIPGFPTVLVPFPVRTNCEIWQRSFTTITETEYESVTHVWSTTTVSGCAPTDESIYLDKRYVALDRTVTAFIDAVAVSTSLPDTTCVESSLLAPVPSITPYPSCNAEQLASVCECALYIYPWTATQHVTVTGMIYYEIVAAEYTSCSTNWTETTLPSSSSVPLITRTKIHPSRSVLWPPSSRLRHNSTEGSPVIATSPKPSSSLSTPCPFENSTYSTASPSQPSHRSHVGPFTTMPSWNHTRSSVWLSHTREGRSSSSSANASITSDSSIGAIGYTSSQSPQFQNSSSVALSTWLSNITSSGEPLSTTSSGTTPLGYDSTYKLPNITVISSWATTTNVTELPNVNSTTSLPGYTSSSSMTPPFPITNTTGSPIATSSVTGVVPLSTGPVSSLIEPSSSIGLSSANSSAPLTHSQPWSSHHHGNHTTWISAPSLETPKVPINSTEGSPLTTSRPPPSGYGGNHTKTIGSTVILSRTTPLGYGVGYSNAISSSILTWSLIHSSGWNNTIDSPVTTSTSASELSIYSNTQSISSIDNGYDDITSPSASSWPISSCVPSVLNSSRTSSGYQAIYAADYTGCLINPYTDIRGFNLIDVTSGKPIVNINGKAEIPSDSSDFEDSYYTFEDQGGPCGVLDLSFHMGDEKTYLAVYSDQSEVGYEQYSSQGQDEKSEYTTSIWSVDCVGGLRAGHVGGDEYMFAVGPGDMKVRSQDSTFIAPNHRRTVRKRTQGIQLQAVPVKVGDTESKKVQKKMV